MANKNRKNKQEKYSVKLEEVAFDHLELVQKNPHRVYKNKSKYDRKRDKRNWKKDLA